MVFPIVAPPDPRGPWCEQFWIYIISESYPVNMTYTDSVVLEKKIFKWPHPIFAFLRLSPFWRRPGPIFEQFRISITQGWFMLSLIEISLLLLEVDWLIIYGFTKNISLIWRRHHYRWRDAKFRPMLGPQGLWAGKDLYHATPAVTRGLGFSSPVGRTVPFSHLLRHTRWSGGSILTRILTG